MKIEYNWWEKEQIKGAICGGNYGKRWCNLEIFFCSVVLKGGIWRVWVGCRKNSGFAVFAVRFNDWTGKLLWAKLCCNLKNVGRKTYLLHRKITTTNAGKIETNFFSQFRNFLTSVKNPLRLSLLRKLQNINSQFSKYVTKLEKRSIVQMHWIAFELDWTGILRDREIQPKCRVFAVIVLSLDQEFISYRFRILFYKSYFWQHPVLNPTPSFNYNPFCLWKINTCQNSCSSSLPITGCF